MANQHPIVFVHGLLGWGRDKMPGLPYFGMADLGVALRSLLRLDLDIAHRALFPSVGPISSNHDRACELFYRLKGGDIRYGREHAAEHGHRETVAAKGAPLYPEWDSAHPLHFVGQAQGASTVRLLQHLLSLGDFFRDAQGNPYPTAADWIVSVTSLSGIHNGTPVAYIAGCSPDDGTIQPYSTAEFLGRTMIAYDGQTGHAAEALHRYFYSLDCDQWEDPRALLAGKDNAVYDLSIHGAQALDFIEDQACTYYFSYLTELDAQSEKMNLLFRYPAEELARFTGPLRNLKYAISDFAPWHASDGLAPVVSQRYPLWGTPRTAQPHPGATFRRGVWYEMGKLAMDHMNPVAMPRLSWTFEQQRELVRFYGDLYQLLTGL